MDVTASSRRTVLALVATVCALALPACTSATTTPKNVRSAVAVAPVSPSASPSSQDMSYLVQAHQTNLAEIAAGQTAQQKGNSQTVRDLGTRFVTDHTALDRSLQDVAAPLGISLPSVPTAAQQALARRYAAASGPDFDRLFVTTQMGGHAQAVQAGRTEMAQGSSPTVKGAARAAAPVISIHAAMLEQAAQTLHLPAGQMSSSPGPTPSPTQ